MHMDKQSADNGCQVYHLFSILPVDTGGGGLSGSHLLLDETVRTGLASTTRCELDGTQTSKMIVYLHRRMSITGSRDC
jgi:hypothetical protein